MYYNLFLDDTRVPKDVKWKNLPPVQWEVVRDYNQFCKIIESRGVPNFVSFDHDLADEHYKQVDDRNEFNYSICKEKTGYDCAKFLVNYCFENKVKFPNYMVHSLNPVGGENIVRLIEGCKIAVLKVD